MSPSTSMIGTWCTNVIAFERCFPNLYYVSLIIKWGCVRTESARYWLIHITCCIYEKPPPKVIIDEWRKNKIKSEDKIQRYEIKYL
jgi:hypothetical protein